MIMKDYKVKNENIELIGFESVLAHWSEYLWPDRDINTILPYSTLINEKDSDPSIAYGSYLHTPYFVGYFLDGALVGVNSGHRSSSTDFRTRGMFVDASVRGQGVGKALLDETMNIGRHLGCNICWGWPRKQSFFLYEKAGFVRIGDWFPTETNSWNCYAKANL